MLQDSKQAMQEFYEIWVQGHLDRERAEWFCGLSVTNTDGGAAILSGPIADQSALYGVLAKIRDLNLPLLALNRIEPAPLEAVHV